MSKRAVYENRAELALDGSVPRSALAPAVWGGLVQHLADLQERAEDEGRNHVIGVCAVEDPELRVRFVWALQRGAEVAP